MHSESVTDNNSTTYRKHILVQPKGKLVPPGA
jgi:hypothetical protein